MEKGQKEWETKAKCVYVPPLIEVHEAVPSRLLSTSFYGNHFRADDGDSDHERAGEGGMITGAKTMILGQEFSFNDVWEE